LALLALDETMDYPDIADNLFWTNLIHVQKVHLQLDGWNGTYSGIERLHAFRPSDGINNYKLINWEMYESLIRVKAMLETGQNDEALAWLNPLWKQAVDLDWLTDKIEILLLQSMAWLHKADKNAAIRYFSQALQLGAPDGYIRIFIDAGKPILELMAEYLSLRKNNYIRDSESVPLSYAKLLATELRLTVSESEDDLLPQKLVQLTSKEQEVIRLIVLGLPNSKIAAELKIGSGTVKTHIHRIYGKLYVNSRVSAVERCIEWNLL
jgi:LuxR family maltose regulon positive regulatory protein